MSLSEEFFQRFGSWYCAEACKMEDLPFASDIKQFLDAHENDKEQIIQADASIAPYPNPGCACGEMWRKGTHSLISCDIVVPLSSRETSTKRVTASGAA